MSQVTTTSGVVEGRSSRRVSAWLGIPYAAAPTGPRRFAPPEPHKGWTGVRPAHAFGSAAMQATSILAPARKLGSGISEDCLYLNVWSPAAAAEVGATAMEAAGRPVLVWIHGGAYVTGSGAMYDGTTLAALGDIVVVTINYRMGVFGFVDVGSVARGGASSNLGLRDIVAALRWVRDNIAGFGGDPSRVTVAGESAGSVAVSLLLVAAEAEGLFRGAIMESGVFSLVHGDRTRSEIATRYVDELRLGGADVDAWRALPAATLLAAQVAVQKSVTGTIAAAPWFDGDLVPASLADARATPPHDVAILAGSNHDEITLFQRFQRGILPVTRAAAAVRLPEVYSAAETARIQAAYPDDRAGERQLLTDFTFAMPTRHLAERHAAAGHRTYFYRLDAGVPVLGATHAADVAHLWDFTGVSGLALRGLPTPSRVALGMRMKQHWVSFVADLDPGRTWPPFTTAARTTKIFDATGDRVEHDPAGAQREVWLGQDVMTRS